MQAAVDARVVLAVSGGADSMVMAELLYRNAPERVVAIATFDHGTGAAARDAVECVAAWARERDLALRVGRAGRLRPSEASWRAARWGFLRETAHDTGAAIATAHTLDDQAETVFMRLLRGAGVRGMAGLRAASRIQRPLLDCERWAVHEFAQAHAVPFVKDPSNRDLRHLRNRVRLELLPRLERESPGFRDWLLALGERAAAWRQDVSAAVDRLWAPTVVEGAGLVEVARDPRRLPSVEEAALFWPEVAARVGVALDRRGTARLASFTTKVESGLRMPLSGGVMVTSARHRWTLGAAVDEQLQSSQPNGWHHIRVG